MHLAGSPGRYFAYLEDCLKEWSKKLECTLSMAEQNIETESKYILQNKQQQKQKQALAL